jgi:hypothetical protein
MHDHPGELIILDVNNQCGYDSDAGSNEYPRLTNQQWDPIVQEIKNGLAGVLCDVQYSGDTYNARLKNYKLNDFIGSGAGCVLPVLNIPGYPENSVPGLWPYSALNNTNDFSDVTDTELMGRDQLKKLAANRVLGKEGDPATRDDLFVLSWTLTPTPLDFPIWQGAGECFNALAGWAAKHFTPFSYPNVLLVDFIGVRWDTENPLGPDQADQLASHTNMDIVGLAIAINLGLASQNCFVGGGGLD